MSKERKSNKEVKKPKKDPKDKKDKNDPKKQDDLSRQLQRRPRVAFLDIENTSSNSIEQEKLLSKVYSPLVNPQNLKIQRISVTYTVLLAIGVGVWRTCDVYDELFIGLLN